MELVTLGNGLRVALAPCEAESAAFGIFVASGSRHEPAELSGISHFIEHMLFKGTPTRTPLDISRAIEGRGGMFNAFTGEEATAYFAHLPWEHLDEAVDILADMFLNASMPADEFEREKQVVLEEIRMYEDDPDAVVFENLQRALFPKSPLGIPISGSAKTLAPLRPSDLKRYRRGHYLPSRTFAVVVGRFERDAALKSVASRLGRFGKGLSAPSLRRAKAPFGRVVASTTAAKDVKQTRFAIGYRTFGFADRRRYAAAVFDAVLGRGMSSRLFQEVREKRGLSYDVSSRMNFQGEHPRGQKRVRARASAHPHPPRRRGGAAAGEGLHAGELPARPREGGLQAPLLRPDAPRLRQGGGAGGAGARHRRGHGGRRPRGRQRHPRSVRPRHQPRRAQQLTSNSNFGTIRA